MRFRQRGDFISKNKEGSWLEQEDWQVWIKSTGWESRTQGIIKVQTGSGDYLRNPRKGSKLFYRVYIPSAGSQLEYNLWIRYLYRAAPDRELPSFAVKKRVETSLVELFPIEEEKPIYISEDRRFVWIRLGRLKANREYYDLAIEGRGSEAAQVYMIDGFLLTTSDVYIRSGEADFEVDLRKQGIEPIHSGVPLGGIGVGKIEICADGLIRHATINNNIDTPVRFVPGALALVRVADEKGEVVAKTLSTAKWYDLPSVETIRFSGLFPEACLEYQDSELKINLSLKAFSSFVPGDAKLSSLPAVVFLYTLNNPTDEILAVSLASSWENLIGMGGDVYPENPLFYKFWDERSGNQQEYARDGDIHIIRFFSDQKSHIKSQGTYTLLSRSAPDLDCSVLLSWDVNGDGKELFEPFMQSGTFDETILKPGGTGAAFAYRFRLKPGETRELPFVLVWHLPDLIDVKGTFLGHYYTNFFSSSEEIARYVAVDLDNLYKKTKEWHELLLDSTLPDWLSKKLINDAAPLYSNSWYVKDGRHSINESPTNMYGCMGTIDQRLVARAATLMFFPELDASELRQFADAQADNGSIPHDLGLGEIDKKHHVSLWADLPSSFAMQVYEHYLSTGDRSFLEELYPNLKKAIHYLRTLDTDNDGIPNMEGVACTYDSSSWYGSSSFVVSLQLVALKIGQRLAEELSDDEFQQECRDWEEQVRQNAIEEIWNGEFFRTYYDKATGRTSDGSHVAQLAGQWYAEMMDLGDIFPSDMIDQAVRFMIEHNNRRYPHFPPDEVGRKGNIISQFSWLLYTIPCYAGLCIYRGFVEEALDCVRRIDQMNQRNGTVWDSRLISTAGDGHTHWGKWYMTMPSSWYIYRALTGFTADIAHKKLMLAPRIGNTKTLKVPLFAPNFWAWLDYEERNEEHETIKEICLRLIKGDAISFDQLVTKVPGQVKRVEIDGKVLTKRTYKQTEERLVINKKFKLSHRAATVFHISFIMNGL